MKRLGHLHGLVEQAARIAAQIEDQALHALASRRRVDRGVELARRSWR